MSTISATEANRSFSKLLARVQRGETVTITSHGTAVARLVPVLGGPSQAEWEEARSRLFERVGRQPAHHLGRFDRDMAYEGD